MPLSFDEFTLWLLLAMLTAAVVAYFVRSLPGGAEEQQSDEADVAVYRDQLLEVDRDVARGTLPEAEAASARLEISRRLLAAADAGSVAAAPLSVRTRRTVAMAIVILLPLFVLGTYLSLGTPGLPAQPYAERLSQPLDALPVEGLVARLEQRLKEEPDDAQGWRLIGPVYLQLGRYGDAINAFGRIMQIEGRDADALAGLGEALTLSGDGMVPAPARQAFEAALGVDPTHARARFYLALSKAQAGQFEQALTDWERLLADAPEGAAWRSAVENQIQAVRERLAQ